MLNGPTCGGHGTEGAPRQLPFPSGSPSFHSPRKAFRAIPAPTAPCAGLRNRSTRQKSSRKSALIRRSHHDLAKFLHTRTENAEQFQQAYLKVTTSPELVPLGLDDQGRRRFTSRDMLGAERTLLENADELAQRPGHHVDPKRRTAVLSQHRLSAEQERAVVQVTTRGDLKALAGVAGSGKSTALTAMRRVWEAEGYTVKGAALAGIAAENLEITAGIQSRTLASYELAWSNGRDPVSRRDVLVIDEAGMIGTKQLERVLAVAQKAHAKVVLVGDPEQLQAIEAGAPFRGITAAHGVSNLTEVRRQKSQWQRDATAALATGKTAAALDAYDKQGGIVAVEKREEARSALLARWASDAKREPHQSHLILGYTRDEVQALNGAVRALRQQSGQLGKTEVVPTEHGKKPFALHDRIRFGRNEKTLGVKNGSLGTVERIEHGVLQIKLDGQEEARVAVDTKFYKHLDYGYATTVHKAQGTTVDRTYILATPHFDRHTSYVALSRHREAATVFYAGDDFGGRAAGATAESVKARFTEALSRARPKELAHDYLEREPTDTATIADLIARNAEKARADERELRPSSMDDIHFRQQQAAERWKAKHQIPIAGKGAKRSPSHSPTHQPSHQRDKTPEPRRDGPEDDFEL
jgi:Ti-type conjugative transfer relaxase TraA